MDGEKRPPPERRLSAPDIRVIVSGDPDAHDLCPTAEKRAHSAHNSPTLPLRILPPPIYTRTSQHQHPAPPPPQIPSPPKVAEAHHSPEHAVGQDQPLPPSPETRPLSEVAEERVTQWVDQEAAARASSQALASTSQQVARSGATQQAVGDRTILAQQRRAVVGQSHIGSAGASQETGRSVALIASNVTVDELADRLLQRIALALPSYHSQAGSSEHNLDPRLNPPAPVPNSDPPSSYRSHTVRQATTTAASQDRSATTGRDQTASRTSRTHLTVPTRHGSHSTHNVGTAPQSSTPVGTEGSQLTATGWMDAFYQFPDPPPSSQLSPRRRSAQPVVPALHADEKVSPTDTRQNATAGQHPSALASPPPDIHQHVSTNTPPVSSMLATAGDTATARPPPAPEQLNRHFTRKVSTSPPKLEPEPQPRRLTVQLREHVRTHPETGLIVTPDPSDELGLPFEAGPELAQLMRPPYTRPMKDACTQTSPLTSRNVQSKQAATVETVYSVSEKWPTPPKGADQPAGKAATGKKSNAADRGQGEQREQPRKAGTESVADRMTGERKQAGDGRIEEGRKEQHIRFTDTSRDAGPEPDRRSARDVNDSKGSKADLPQVEAKPGQERQAAQSKSESQICLPNSHADTKEVHGHTKSQQTPRTLLSKAKEYWNAITEEDRKSIVTDWSGSVDSNENGGRRDVCRWPTELPPMVRCHGTTRCLEHNWTERPGELITTNRMGTGQMDKDERSMRARLLDRSQPGCQQPDRDQQQRRRPEQAETSANNADKKGSGGDQRSSTKRANDNKKERKGSDPDVIEIPRSRSPDHREQRPRVVSYAYVGRPDLDHRDLHRPSNHRRDADIPQGESYRRSSTIVRKGRSGDTDWRFEEREADACDNRVRYGTAPAPASRSKTRTVVTEHTDVFGQIVRQERSTTVSSSTRPREQRKRSAPRHSLPVEFDFSSSSDSDVPPAFAHRGTRAPHAVSREMPMSMPMMPLGMVPPQMIMQFGLPMAWSRSKGSWYT